MKVNLEDKLLLLVELRKEKLSTHFPGPGGKNPGQCEEISTESNEVSLHCVEGVQEGAESEHAKPYTDVLKKAVQRLNRSHTRGSYQG